MAEFTGEREASLYQLLDALKATINVEREYKSDMSRGYVTLTLSAWSDKERESIKQEILKQLNLLANNE